MNKNHFTRILSPNSGRKTSFAEIQRKTDHSTEPQQPQEIAQPTARLGRS